MIAYFARQGGKTFYATYKELKLANINAFESFQPSFYATYKELKLR